MGDQVDKKLDDPYGDENQDVFNRMHATLQRRH